MAQNDPDKLPAGPQLDALVAERVFGWKDIHRQTPQDYWGKKQDKAGRWRMTRVPDFSTDVRFAAEIEERMKELKLVERYQKELARTARSKGLPGDWALPDQRCRAALKTVRSQPVLKLVKK